MRVLLLMRGAPGCGKSTYIDKNGLRPYALSADEIRLMCQSSQMTAYGSEEISMANDKTVWNMLFKMLEVRMQNGEFTVIDATNSKTSEMNRYKKMCNAYRYRMYCVDFTDLPVDECKRRNRNREALRVVPDEVIDKMYARFATQKIPSGIKVIKPEELDSIWMKKIDFSGYKKIVHIGDIHGCNTVLQEYLKNGIEDDVFYIFLGDFIDRGIENAEVLRFILSIKDKKNVLFLEGNHEKWLWIYGNGGTGGSKEFELATKPQLQEAGVDQKELRQLYRKFAQCAYYSYGTKDIFVSHGGISYLPDNLTTLATHQMIKGVGTYNDAELIADTWLKRTRTNCYQIHGHRNIQHLPIQVNDRVFNLEGHVEFGGHLRIVELDENGFHPIEIKNNVFKTLEEVEKTHQITNSSVADTVIAMRANRFIQEKKFDNISSFNFTKQAFFDKVWDDQTVTARGLYIDTDEMKVVARGYTKFFNINERPETKFDMLQHKLQFPVTAYVKENGFLGLVSYDKTKNDLFITTKSSPTGRFAEWLKDMLYAQTTEDVRNQMKQYIKLHDVTFVFECVDMKNDPHIIDYGESNLFLLDIIYNDLEFKKYSYDEMCRIADTFGLTHKEKAFVLEDWGSFFDWYNEILVEDYLYNGREIEGL